MTCGTLDIRGVAHRGYFATITDFTSYYQANISLIDSKLQRDCSMRTGRFIHVPTIPARLSISGRCKLRIPLSPMAARLKELLRIP